MIAQAPADAPLLLKIAAAAALYLHVGGASVGLVSGTVAALARKGGRLHRNAGNVFVASMLTMSAAAAVSAPFIPDRITAMMGVFTFYLVATAWMAARRRPGEVGRFETGAMLAALVIALAYAALAGIGAASPDGTVDGEQPFSLAIMGAVLAGLAGALDLRVVRRGGLSGGDRIARHLWRMSLALFVAWGSFAGQPKAQPEALRGSPYLFLPALAVLVLMVVWLVRVRVRRLGAPAAAAV